MGSIQRDNTNYCGVQVLCSNKYCQQSVVKANQPLRSWMFQYWCDDSTQLLPDRKKQWATEIASLWSLHFKTLGSLKHAVNSHCVSSRADHASHGGGRKLTPMLNFCEGVVWFIVPFLIYSVPFHLDKRKAEGQAFKGMLFTSISVKPSAHVASHWSKCDCYGWKTLLSSKQAWVWQWQKDFTNTRQPTIDTSH